MPNTCNEKAKRVKTFWKMSDTSLNELQPKLIKLEKTEEETSLLSTLKKPTSSSSIFVVPSQQTTSSNLTTVTLLNDKSIQNKITVVPFNISTQKSTTPIKVIQDLNATSPIQPKTTIISSLGNSKKLIQINSSTSTTNTTTPNLASSPIRSNNIIITSSDKSPQGQSNTKILTITNGLNANSSVTNTNNKIQTGP